MWLCGLDPFPWTGGLFNGICVSNHFNPVYGRDAMIASGLSSTLETDYGYDAYGRMNAVSNGASSVGYGYLPDSDLLQTTTFSNASSAVLITARQWDYGFRLGSIANVVNGATVTSDDYTYDDLNRRTRANLEDGSLWNYSYNNRNELTGAGRFWSDWTAVTGQQYGYGFDNIGNRISAQSGSVGNLSTVSYTVNGLNEYTGIVTPGCKDILGLAIATNAVTVNGGVADRKVEYFHRNITIANGNGPVWQNVTNSAGSSTVKGGLVFPANSQALLYDADGNLTSDGIWTYEWDAENRLITMSMNNLYGIANSNVLQLTFAYDFMNRRISKTVWTNSGSSFVPQSTNYFIYDGWNLIAVFTPASAIEQSFVWGLDLSGTVTNAGGVGGLLAIASSGTNYFASYDGNGNITGLINGVDKSVGARYEYSPFGELLRATGPMAKANPCRLGTKVTDDESGLVYYGYRYYYPTQGRWLGRDHPKGEAAALKMGKAGTLNLFLFCQNTPRDRIDTDGRDDLSLISLNSAMSLDAAFSGATPFIAEGFAQVLATLGSAYNGALAYAAVYSETASLMLSAGANESLIYQAGSLALGFVASGAGQSAGDEFMYSMGDLLGTISEETANPNATAGEQDAEVDYIADPNSK
jgi:RHS repeat-associated protein